VLNERSQEEAVARLERLFAQVSGTLDLIKSACTCVYAIAAMRVLVSVLDECSQEEAVARLKRLCAQVSLCMHARKPMQPVSYRLLG
jgi:hypothetical protein